MKQLVLQILDTVSLESSISICTNVPTFIRQNLQSIISYKPLKDLELIEIGYYENGKFDFLISSDYKKHSWDEYKFPETKAEALAPLGASEEVLKQAFSEKVSDVK